MTEPAYRDLGREMNAVFAESVESYEGFGSVRVHVHPLAGAVERERNTFYALATTEFRARLARCALWGALGQFRALIEQVRRPAAPVSWPRRAGFALWLTLATPLYIAYVALVQPGRLRARRAAKLAGPERSHPA